MVSAVPLRVLETERLTLRWFDERDAAFILALVNDPDWIANIGDRNLHTEDEARVWIRERLVASYWQKGLGLWAMERRTDGVLVGMGGLVERDSLPAVDVGYALAPPFRGQGYAREAAEACLRYARDVLGQEQVLAIVWPENRASIRVLEAVGMVAEGVRHLAGDDRPTAVFRWGRATSETEPAPDGPSAARDIDVIARRFFAGFSNRTAPARVAAIPSLFLPEAIVTVVKPDAPRGIETLSVRDFVTPRAELLQSGRLTDFEEEEVSQETTVTGGLAQRACRYRKAGSLDGARFEGGGNKRFQLVRTTRGWKIAALGWEETG